MDAFPHHYQVSAEATQTSPVSLKAEDLPEIVSAPPAQFGGPGDKWSPEDLLIAAIADCFILSFRAIANASKFEWTRLACEVSGTLDRVERVTQFTAIHIKASLELPSPFDTNNSDANNGDAISIEKADKLLHKAEQSCLITNSLKADSTLSTQINLSR